MLAKLIWLQWVFLPGSAVSLALPSSSTRLKQQCRLKLVLSVQQLVNMLVLQKHLKACNKQNRYHYRTASRICAMHQEFINESRVLLGACSKAAVLHQAGILMLEDFPRIEILTYVSQPNDVTPEEKRQRIRQHNSSSEMWTFPGI